MKLKSRRSILELVNESNQWPTPDDDAAALLEIERKYLLSGLPEFPPGTIAVKIEQGYLPEGEQPEPGGEERLEGRLRRTTMPDGTECFLHTIKRGRGLVREEREREMTRAEFEEQWPRTESRRLRKTRHRVPAGLLIWEIDEFDQLDIVLAEIELPNVDTIIDVPGWLASWIIREVTDEPVFRNYELALREAGE